VGEAGVKVSSFNGKVCSVTPEYEDCKLLAEKNNIPLKSVQQMLVGEFNTVNPK
jgi:uncharacterized protein (DUF111 family)